MTPISGAIDALAIQLATLIIGDDADAGFLSASWLFMITCLAFIGLVLRRVPRRR